MHLTVSLLIECNGEITNGEEGGKMHVFGVRRNIGPGFREDQPVLDQSKSFLAACGYQEPMPALA